jgi:hypothetical protein
MDPAPPPAIAAVQDRCRRSARVAEPRILVSETRGHGCHGNPESSAGWLILSVKPVKNESRDCGSRFRSRSHPKICAGHALMAARGDTVTRPRPPVQAPILWNGSFSAAANNSRHAIKIVSRVTPRPPDLATSQVGQEVSGGWPCRGINGPGRFCRTVPPTLCQFTQSTQSSKPLQPILSIWPGLCRVRARTSS